MLANHPHPTSHLPHHAKCRQGQRGLRVTEKVIKYGEQQKKPRAFLSFFPFWSPSSLHLSYKMSILKADKTEGKRVRKRESILLGWGCLMKGSHAVYKSQPSLGKSLHNTLQESLKQKREGRETVWVPGEGDARSAPIFLLHTLCLPSDIW